MTKLKNIGLGLILAGTITGFTGCSDADVVSRNLSQSADAFEINRRVVFYNGINGEYMLEITGLCSINPVKGRLEVVCKTGANSYKKHFLGLSNNVTYFAEQIESSKQNKYHYKVVFKPQAIIPDINFEGDINAGINAVIPDNKD